MMEIVKVIEDVLITVKDVELKLAESSQGEQGAMILDLVNKFSTLASAINNQENDHISLDDYNEKLNMLLTAFENQDYDLMVSVLQIEVRPLLEYWLI